MTELQTYKGKSAGDTVKFNSESYPAFHTGKIVKIFKKLNEVYIDVRVRGGSVISLPASLFLPYEDAKKDKLCNCDIGILMRSGCLCGGK